MCPWHRPNVGRRKGEPSLHLCWFFLRASGKFSCCDWEYATLKLAATYFWFPVACTVSSWLCICFAASMIRAVKFQGCWKHQTESQSASYRADYFGLLIYVRVTTFCHFSFRENKIVFHGSWATPEIRCETAVGCFKLLVPQAPCLLNTYMYTTNCREKGKLVPFPILLLPQHLPGSHSRAIPICLGLYLPYWRTLVIAAAVTSPSLTHCPVSCCPGSEFVVYPCKWLSTLCYPGGTTTLLARKV